MTPRSPRPVVRVDADPDRRHRFPDASWVQGRLVRFRPALGGDRGQGDQNDRDEVGKPSERGSGMIVDRATGAPEASLGPEPTLLGLDALTLLLEDGRVPESDTWLPLLPTAYSADLRAARRCIAEGEIGTPRFAQVTTPLGFPSSDGAEADHVAALSRSEALVFGMHILERLTGARVASSGWLVDGPPVGVLSHRLEPDVRAIHRVQPTGFAPITMYECEVTGDSGRVVVRNPFAPGAVGVWRAQPDTEPGYVFGTIAGAKPDPQAPDSTPGGAELLALVGDLLSSDAPETGGAAHPADLTSDAVRADALRLLRHVHQIPPGGPT